MINSIFKYFTELCGVPRVSHKEAAICDYLCHWAEKEGLQVRKHYVSTKPGDDENRFNVIIDVPATEGRENTPVTILQAHMDMVAASALAYEPVISHLVYAQDEEILKSDGTVNIGADDGLGIATIQHVITDKNLSHGPLRAIFTVDEEDGMEGAEELAEEFVADAGYVINCDWEDADTACVSCAGGRVFRFTKDVDTVPMQGELYKLRLMGLMGGHSGTEIHKGYANAILSLGFALKELEEAGVRFHLVSFAGGTAKNAIPDNAEVIIAVSEEDGDKLQPAFKAAVDAFQNIYGNTEPSVVFTMEPCCESASVMYGETDTKRLMQFLLCLPDGVNTMSAHIPELVESSSNLGRITCDAEKMQIEVLERSSVEAMADRQQRTFMELGEVFGFKAECLSSFPGWSVNPKSRLTELCKEVYREMTGKEIRIEPVHAGLECGFFASKNPKLDIISIGATVKDIHTVQETAYLRTLPITVGIIYGILNRI